jgi:hypoxanthine phosphoribosyltransferase
MIAPISALEAEPLEIHKIHETWQDVHDKSLLLASMIEQHCLVTGEQFDKMVVVPRGSFYPANIVSREFNFSATEILSAHIGSYKPGKTVREDNFEYGQMPSPEEVRDRDLLIIEEVCDSGHTLRHLTDLLYLAGAGLVRTGVLHYKPGESKTGFVPDWYVAETNDWIVYPWEELEEHGKLSVVKRQPTVAE